MAGTTRKRNISTSCSTPGGATKSATARRRLWLVPLLLFAFFAMDVGTQLLFRRFVVVVVRAAEVSSTSTETRAAAAATAATTMGFDERSPVVAGLRAGGGDRQQKSKNLMQQDYGATKEEKRRSKITRSTGGISTSVASTNTSIRSSSRRWLQQTNKKNNKKNVAKKARIRANRKNQKKKKQQSTTMRAKSGQSKTKKKMVKTVKKKKKARKRERDGEKGKKKKKSRGKKMSATFSSSTATSRRNNNNNKKARSRASTRNSKTSNSSPTRSKLSNGYCRDRCSRKRKTAKKCFGNCKRRRASGDKSPNKFCNKACQVKERSDVVQCVLSCEARQARKEANGATRDDGGVAKKKARTRANRKSQRRRRRKKKKQKSTMRMESRTSKAKKKEKKKKARATTRDGGGVTKKKVRANRNNQRRRKKKSTMRSKRTTTKKKTNIVNKNKAANKENRGKKNEKNPRTDCPDTCRRKRKKAQDCLADCTRRASGSKRSQNFCKKACGTKEHSNVLQCVLSCQATKTRAAGGVLQNCTQAKRVARQEKCNRKCQRLMNNENRLGCFDYCISNGRGKQFCTRVCFKDKRRKVEACFGKCEEQDGCGGPPVNPQCNTKCKNDCEMFCVRIYTGTKVGQTLCRSSCRRNKCKCSGKPSKTVCTRSCKRLCRIDCEIAFMSESRKQTCREACKKNICTCRKTKNTQKPIPALPVGPIDVKRLPLAPCDQDSDCRDSACALQRYDARAPKVCCPEGAWVFASGPNRPPGSQPLRYCSRQPAGEACGREFGAGVVIHDQLCENSQCGLSSYRPSASYVCCYSGIRVTAYNAGFPVQQGQTSLYCTGMPNGDPCRVNQQCESGICTTEPLSNRIGQCIGRALGRGATCNEDLDCQNGVCSREKMGVPTRNVCCPTDEKAVAKDGNTYCKQPTNPFCGHSEDSDVCSNGKCGLKSYRAGEQHICCPSGDWLSLPPAGSTPGTANEYYCTGMLNGDPCMVSSQCASGFCTTMPGQTTGVCTRQKWGQGSRCGRDSDCQNGVCATEVFGAVGSRHVCCSSNEKFTSASGEEYCKQPEDSFCGNKSNGEVCSNGKCGLQSYRASAQYVCCPSGDVLELSPLRAGTGKELFCTGMPNGDPCVDSGQCASGFCNIGPGPSRVGRCEKQKAGSGSICGIDVDCQNDACALKEMGTNRKVCCPSSSKVSMDSNGNVYCKQPEGSFCDPSINGMCSNDKCGLQSYRYGGQNVCCPSGDMLQTNPVDFLSSTKKEWYCTGMPNGDPCRENGQCSSGICTTEPGSPIVGICIAQKLENGATCGDDANCQNGACALKEFGSNRKVCCPSNSKAVADGNGKVYCKQTAGSFCSHSTNSDMCMNDKCGLQSYRAGAQYICCPSGEWLLTAPVNFEPGASSAFFCSGMPNGDPCRENGQCSSGICTTEPGSPTIGSCIPSKLGEGALCGEDSDCQNEACALAGFGTTVTKVCCSTDGKAKADSDGLTYCKLSTGQPCQHSMNSNVCANGKCGRESYHTTAQHVCCPSNDSVFVGGSFFCTGVQNGEPCAVDAQCASGACDVDGVCGVVG